MLNVERNFKTKQFHVSQKIKLTLNDNRTRNCEFFTGFCKARTHSVRDQRITGEMRIWYRLQDRQVKVRSSGRRFTVGSRPSAGPKQASYLKGTRPLPRSGRYSNHSLPYSDEG